MLLHSMRQTHLGPTTTHLFNCLHSNICQFEPEGHQSLTIWFKWYVDQYSWLTCMVTSIDIMYWPQHYQTSNLISVLDNFNLETSYTVMPLCDVIHVVCLVRKWEQLMSSHGICRPHNNTIFGTQVLAYLQLYQLYWEGWYS